MIKSKLKKRIRKKFHLGEFKELGFEVSVNFKKELGDEQFDKFWNGFINEIEENNLMCGGGGDYKIWKVFVTSRKKFVSPTINEVEHIKIWLENCIEVKSFEIGDFSDAWNE